MTPLLIKIFPIVQIALAFLLSAWTVAFLIRIVLTWYPKKDLTKGFWIFVAWPTEFLLIQTRKLVPTIGGVDVTPVIWVGLISLVRELLVGQQGILSQLLVSNKFLI